MPAGYRLATYLELSRLQALPLSLQHGGGALEKRGWHLSRKPKHGTQHAAVSACVKHGLRFLIILLSTELGYYGVRTARLVAHAVMYVTRHMRHSKPNLTSTPKEVSFRGTWTCRGPAAQVSLVTPGPSSDFVSLEYVDAFVLCAILLQTCSVPFVSFLIHTLCEVLGVKKRARCYVLTQCKLG